MLRLGAEVVASGTVGHATSIGFVESGKRLLVLTGSLLFVAVACLCVLIGRGMKAAGNSFAYIPGQEGPRVKPIDLILAGAMVVTFTAFLLRMSW